jgi:exopolysaccharide biosynthesis protein
MEAQLHSSNKAYWNMLEIPKFSESQKIQNLSFCWKVYVIRIPQRRKRAISVELRHVMSRDTAASANSDMLRRWRGAIRRNRPGISDK